MSVVQSMLGELQMISDVERLIINKRGQFEDEFGDIIIWYDYNKDQNSWYFLMMGKKNRDKHIERTISNAQIGCANLDILWFEFDSMRRRLMK